MVERLFVYGTLRPGESNEHYLAPIAGKWMNASIRGIHFPHGYGATEGYPVLALSQHGRPIPGLVLEAQFSQVHWQTLDEFETDAYERVLTTVALDRGAELSAFVYVLNAADRNRLAQELPELNLSEGS
jgi:gamma-glutamylcyclotransferase (GGCT)/AIG2-like uncharacterized protein YtfP